jgi:hypothetical protein
MKILTIVFVIFFVFGCSTVSTIKRPMSYSQNNQFSSDISLFDESVGELSEEGIQKILSYRLAFPPQNRVAILNLSQNNYWRYYTSDFVHLDDSIVKGFIGELNKSLRIYDASFLPSMLIPEKKSLTQLRTAAARYQADILLTYRSNCQTFEKYKLISPDVIKAYCIVEAIVIDVRSGIVAFTAISTNEYRTEKKEQELNFQETMKKAEIKAIASGLIEVASKLRLFLENMPIL